MHCLTFYKRIKGKLSTVYEYPLPHFTNGHSPAHSSQQLNAALPSAQPRGRVGAAYAVFLLEHVKHERGRYLWTNRPSPLSGSENLIPIPRIPSSSRARG